MKRPICLLVILTAALVLPERAMSQKPQPPARHDQLEQRAVESWHEDLAAAEQYLLEGKWKQARRTSERVSRELTHRIETGEGAARFLAQAAAIQAVAEAGLRLEREAAWSWSTALQLFPNLRDFRLEAFGEAGAFLAAVDPSKPPGLAPPDLSPEDLSAQPVPPRKVKAPLPDFPKAQLERITEPVHVVVQVIVDRKGVPHSPRILQAEGEPTFMVSTLAAMRDWRFEPARLNGKPVDVFYNMTVSYTRSGM